jgi:glucose-1-phosphate thymidylyltransferase
MMDLPFGVPYTINQAFPFIKKINIKSDSTNLPYAGIIAVWGSDFTEFLHEYVLSHQKLLNRNKSHSSKKNIKELFIGEIIQAGIRKSLKIDYVIFKEGDYIDIGPVKIW